MSMDKLIKERKERLSKISPSDIEKAEACREWVNDYEELKLNKNTLNRKETVLYWKEVFEEELPECILENYYRDLLNVKLGMLKIPFYNGIQIDNLQRVLSKAFRELISIQADLAFERYEKKTLMQKREKVFPTPKILDSYFVNTYEIEKKLVAPAQVGSPEWIAKFDKIPNYILSGTVLSNIQPIEEISDGGRGYKLNIYGKINGVYPITITVARNIKIAKICKSMQEAYNVGLRELKNITNNPIFPDGK